MFWVYILKCSDGSYYTGHTDNLEMRIAQHQAGECPGYTATRLPAELVWTQEFNSREEALAAERQIKGWGRKKKEAMMRGDWAEVSRLAQIKSAHGSTSSPRTDLLLRGDNDEFDPL
ncbi:MAG: GIY-YIG nuclease family protein [Methylococcaceae bacterium]|nr:GIY-YIG nuclease family protein [Methylococcaceae bacterium]